jgi:hypothetical protein
VGLWVSRTASRGMSRGTCGRILEFLNDQPKLVGRDLFGFGSANVLERFMCLLSRLWRQCWGPRRDTPGTTRNLTLPVKFL